MDDHRNKASEPCAKRINDLPHIPVRQAFDGYANNPNSVWCSQCGAFLGRVIQQSAA